MLQKFAGQPSIEMKRLHELEAKNSLLKMMVADLTRDKPLVSL